ncbi:MAG: M50 family metallopeptidase [Candidatus Hodarchaeota archaeon]
MFSFTSKEKQELIIGTTIFVLVGLSLVINPLEFILNIDIDLIPFLVILACFMIPLWLFHELAHKFSAQYYGLYSEFRLYPNFALLSIISAFLPVKIIAPGVVHIRGGYRSDISARTAMAGPLINILIGGIFLSLAAISSYYWSSLLAYVSYLSFYLALFNLLPFSVLDGATIFHWNQSFYILLLGLTIIFYLFHPIGFFGS